VTPNLTRLQLAAVASLLWMAALALPLFTLPSPIAFDIVLTASFGTIVIVRRNSPRAPFYLVAGVAAAALWALGTTSYPALQVAGDGAVTLAAFEVSVLRLAWPRAIPRLAMAGVEQIRAAALRVGIGILTALVVVLLGYINLPAVTLMAVIGAVAAAVVLQLSARRS